MKNQRLIIVSISTLFLLIVFVLFQSSNSFKEFNDWNMIRFKKWELKYEAKMCSWLVLDVDEKEIEKVKQNDDIDIDFRVMTEGSWWLEPGNIIYYWTWGNTLDIHYPSLPLWGIRLQDVFPVAMNEWKDSYTHYETEFYSKNDKKFYGKYTNVYFTLHAKNWKNNNLWNIVIGKKVPNNNHENIMTHCVYNLPINYDKENTSISDEKLLDDFKLFILGE